jgi:anti-sigma B factor antagonist
MRNDRQSGAEFAIQRSALDGERVVIAVQGELDLAHAGELKELLLSEVSAGASVVLDLAGVDFIDSTGLAAIVTALKRSKDSGCELELHPELQPQARRLMELTGVLPHLLRADGVAGKDRAVTPSPDIG